MVRATECDKGKRWAAKLMLSIGHPNSIAICAFVSHTVSPSIRTSNRMLLSGW